MALQLVRTKQNLYGLRVEECAQLVELASLVEAVEKADGQPECTT
jgi:hypothetical protein